MFIEGEIPAVVSTTGNGGGNNGGFGNGDGWWAIILFALIFGYGRGGFGGFGGGQGGGSGYDGTPYGFALATDFATLERKLDSVNSGICDSTYALNNTITNGFFGVQNALCQGFSGVNLGLTTQGYETRNAITDVGYRLQDCCCKTQNAIQGVNYNLAQNTCAITNAINNTTRDVIENANANFRALHDEIIANKIEAKNERIAELTQKVNGLQLRASQEAQNAYLLSELKPCGKPAYLVPNPNCCYNPCGCNGTTIQ